MKTLTIIFATFVISACGPSFDIASESDRQEAQIEWEALDELGRDVLCDMYVAYGDDLIDQMNAAGTHDRGQVEARFDLIQEEC